MAQAKNWCFTLNNYTAADEEKLAATAQDERVKYLVYGRELAPETGTPHLQGYIELDRRFRLGQLKRLGGLGGAHLEAARGSGQSNREYCVKDRDVVEFGEACAAGQGRRSDIDNVRELVKTTGSIRVVSDKVTSYQALRFAEAYLKYHGPTRQWETQVRWFHGRTGSGKTRRALEEAEGRHDPEWIPESSTPRAVYWKLACKTWWDGYDGHDDVILDDFRPDWFSFSYLLGLLDRYPFLVETKGGTRQLLARRIWITAPVAPDLMFCGTIKEDDILQLLRRITEIRSFP